MPHSKTDSSPYKVQVLDRALSILRLLGERPGDRSLAEVCAGLKLHKSTGHRLLTVLEQNRFVEKSPSTGRYRLGLRLFELGSKAIASLDLREQSRPHLNMVLQETEETVHFCLFNQGEVLYIEKMEPQRSVRMSSSIGRRAPAYCTAVGKAILAELPVSEVNAIAPGVFRTDLNSALLDDTARGKEFLLRTPMARFGQTDELVGAAVFLASDSASFVNGHVLAVDGGFLASGVNQ